MLLLVVQHILNTSKGCGAMCTDQLLLLEAEGHFDHLNEVDIYCLHYIFVPRINQALSSFVEGWNNHSMST